MGPHACNRRKFLNTAITAGAAVVCKIAPAFSQSQKISEVPIEAASAQHGDLFFWRHSKARGFYDVQKIETLTKANLTGEFSISVTSRLNQVRANDDCAIVLNHTLVFPDDQGIANGFGYRRIDTRDKKNIRDSANESVDTSIPIPSRNEFLAHHNLGLDSRHVRLRLSHYTVDDIRFGEDLRSTRDLFADMEFLPFSENANLVRSASTLLVEEKSVGVKVMQFIFSDHNDATKIYASMHFANLMMNKRRFKLIHG